MIYKYKYNSISQPYQPIKVLSANQEKKMSSYQMKQCEARDYGDCYLRIDEYDVTFKYRDAKGRHQPDEIVKVCMCENHYNWLSKIQQGNPLEMHGEVPQYAVHDNLFSHFANKTRMYTLMKVEFEETDVKEEQYHLFNGRDVDAMSKVIQEWFPNKDCYIHSCEEGFFHTTHHYNAETKDCYQVVFEVKNITGELAIAALANDLSHVHMMTPEGTKVVSSPSTYTWHPRADTDPVYVKEPMPELFKLFFKTKQDAETFVTFKECVEFIGDVIDKDIINWTQHRENSPHTTEKELFEKSQQLTNALLRKDEACIKEMQDALDMTADVLWVTYITANHRLFASRDPNKDLTKSKQLVDLFVIQGLAKALLVLAIAGERERNLFVKRRAHYNILRENEFVVVELVPRVISGTDIIYKSEQDELTSLAYWNYYDNTTTYMGGGFCFDGNNTETFKKNENIRLHLERHMPPGKLDVNVLSAKALSFYKQIKANGHHDAEFVIFGYPALFEYRPLSYTNNFKKVTVEEGEKIMPGITARFEEKKRKLRANDYAEWQKMNATLLQNKYE